MSTQIRPLDASRAVSDPDRLAALERTDLLDTLPEESFDRLTRLASRLFEAPVSLVSFVTDARQFFKSQIGLDADLASKRQTPLSHSFCQHVVASGEPLVIEDARIDPVLKDNPAVKELGVIAYAGMPVATTDGFVLGTLCVIDHVPRAWSDDDLSSLRDLASTVIAEIELRQSRRAAMDLVELKERFFRTVLHELAHPATAMRLASQMLAESGPLSPQQKRLVDISRDSSEELSRLFGALESMRDVYDWSPEVAPVDLEDVVKRAAVGAGAEFASGESRIQLKVRAVPTVLGDDHALVQVFRNLFGNALKYSPEEAPVVIEVDQRSGWAVVAVKDDGRGIPRSEIQDLGKAFFRASNTDAVPGTGLGLSLCSEIVHRHGGSLHIESELGEGSTFEVKLPIGHRAHPENRGGPMRAAAK